MSTKWADYGISAVKFNPRHTHIDQVRIMEDQGNSFGPSSTTDRQNVVSALKRGVTFVTLVQGANNTWNKGAPVYIERINGVEYITTVRDGRTADNLDKLPEY
jgi:hypothetical protein